MAVFKTIQFLPEVFRTDTNRKFLNATMDQLFSEPKFKKINGYIGRKLSPSYKSTDNYIPEPTSDRQHYQLEPSLVIRNSVNNNIDFATTYTDIVNQIKYYGGLTDRHDRLFDGEYYSFDPKIDFDKFINFSQYYWLENGPDAVLISAANIPLNNSFTVRYDSSSNSYHFGNTGLIPNPSLTLARGGTYTFTVADTSNPFYIQSKPGVSGTDPFLPNINTRNVLGVDNNGTDNGVVTFTVPTISAQSQWTSMNIATTVDYATNLSYQDLQGAVLNDLTDVLGGLDGITPSVDGKTIAFVNIEKIDDIFWQEIIHNTVDGITTFESTGDVVPLTERNDVYSISVVVDSDEVQRIALTRIVSVENEQKIQVRSGLSNTGKEFFCREEVLQEIPLITAPLDTLYYQNGSINDAVGIIKIVDLTTSTIDPATDIIGQQNYTSPSGVIFTNGLKVTFDSSVSEGYQNKTFYVEGVGSKIRLVLVSSLIAPELDNDLSTQDYFTINRSSLDQNAWSRSNRWFHSEVILKTAEYNNTIPIFDQAVRASRPIIEFNADLQLYNYGSESKLPIDILDTVVTNAYTQIQGVVCNNTTSHTFDIGGTSVVLVSGTRVVFTNDINDDVRNKIFNFSIIEYSEVPDTVVYRAYIEETTDTEVLANHTLVVNMNTSLQPLTGTVDGNNNKKQWYYNGTSWKLCQQKTAVNQEPLFDVVDSNGISFSNPTSYSGSTFIGTKLFSYQQGSGTADPVLGIPLSYRNFNTQGDIQFNNYFDQDKFSYLDSSGNSNVVTVNTGLLQKNITRSTSIRQNIWTIVEHFSKQFQTYSFIYDGSTNLFPIDYLPDVSVNTPNIKVFVNNSQITVENFAVTLVVDRLAILVNSSILKENDSIFVNIYNNSIAAPNAFYEVPINLDVNSLNSSLNSLTLGQIRNHLIALKTNSLNISGDVPGNSNIRDIQYLRNGGSILQHSAPVVYAGLFLTHPTMNFVNAIKFATNEYSKFKIKFLELAANPSLDRSDISGSVDIILSIINEIKNDSFPWIYSDMVPYKAMGPNNLPTYTVINPELKSYEISRIFEDTKLSNKAVFVYLTRVVNNESQKTLLVKDQDFIFNQDRPAITFKDSFTLLYGDLIDIVEYDNTDGSYVPETPTKLGLYPKFVPEIYTDNTYRTPIQVIQGHDGSITPAFGDFRDLLLLELERRIYNNIKINYDTNLFNLRDHIPGKFRVTNYVRQEFDQVLSQGFLTWVGTNRVDYTTNNVFESSDPFTWNYKNFRDTINGESLPGTWRSVFRYFYDTDRPHTHPWEMLGFSMKPDWWEDRYGPAPYTGGNAILWSDLSLGYIHSGPRAGFDIRYQRPNLAQIIPVDENGNLRSPAEMLVTNYDSSQGNISYAVGDIGPSELAWRRSSEYPFMLQLALALTKPARYFSLLSNITNYKRDVVTAQFTVGGTGQHITPTSIKINGYNNNGTIERSIGYLNYIRDYVKNLGIADPETVIKNNLTELSVQLTYKMAGYTDKKYISLLAEQSSPSSINDSIVIPDENYRLELYKGSPVNKITYSAVIIEKSESGWTVSGYDASNPYFFIIPSLPNNNAYTITSGTQRGVIYRDYQKRKVTIPYGFEFNTTQQVVDFLVSYQRYLVAQGFIFNSFEQSLKEEKNWILSAKEFLHWHQQGWKVGSVIVLSPISTELQVYDSESVVDEIVNTPYGSKVLDINFQVIKKNDFTISRENNLFTFKSNSNQTVGFAELVLTQYEHLLILDNKTAFNDVIYLPELGNRQYRLKILGNKTDLWNGSLELPGFLYSSTNVPEWNSGTDYLKGSIVKNKSLYYTALQDVTAAEKFQTLYWKLIPSTELKSGIVNNFATNASQSLNFYNIDDQPVDEKFQIFSNGIIGFRNRDYFSNLGIDYATQSKFYQGMIKQKGTSNALNALQGALFNNINTNINFYENWAVRVGEYGATDANQSIEIVLDEQQISSSPSGIKFVDSSDTDEAGIVSYTRSDLYKITGDWSKNIFRVEDLNVSPQLKPLPVAGFVNTADVDATIFDLADYSTLTTIVDSIGTGFKIWTARNLEGKWDVLRACIIDGNTFALSYTADDLVQLRHTDPHGLIVGDLIVLKNFDIRFNGVYQVNSVVDANTVSVVMYQNLQTIIDAQIALGSGVLFKLSSLKVNTPHLVDTIRPSNGWITDDKIWVENLDENKNWGVYSKTDVWDFYKTIELDESQYTTNSNFGESVVISPDGLYLYGSSPGTAKVNLFKSNVSGEWVPFGFVWANGTNLDGFGKAIAVGDGYLVVGAPDSQSKRGYVYVFKDQVLIQTIATSTGSSNDLFGFSIALSHDARFMYIGAPGEDKVYCYALANERPEFSKVFTGDGQRTKFAINSLTEDAIDYIVTLPLRSAEYISYIDYTSEDFVDGVESLITSFYDSSSDYYDISGSTAVDPFPTSSVISYQVSATGGSGSGAKFNVLRTAGSTTYKVQIVEVGNGYTSGDTLTILGSLVGGVDTTNDITLTIDTVYSGSSLVFGTAPANNERIAVTKRNQYYKLIDTLPISSESLGGNDFGTSVVCNSDGSVIAVGAPNQPTSEYNNSGSTYVYHRTLTEFITNGITGTFNLPVSFNTVRRVTLDGTVLIEGTDYYIVGSSVQFTPFKTPGKSKRLVVETNQFIYDQQLSCAAGDNFKAGSKLAMCGTGCNIFISSAGYHEGNYNTGSVTRFINVGRVYGTITGTVVNPTVNIGDSLVINNRTIIFTGTTLDDVITIINQSNITGVSASNFDGKLKITSDVNEIGSKLYITSDSGSGLTDLGLNVYIKAQTITHLEKTAENFATEVSVNPSSTVLAIGSEGSSVRRTTTFDLETTTFDSDSTKVLEFVTDAGAVYVYSLMNNPFETQEDPAVFAYTQRLSEPYVYSGYNFGGSISVRNNLIAVGVTKDSSIITNGGSIYTYSNPDQLNGWNLIRYKEPRVDIAAINSAFIYNTKTKLLSTHLDYIDPAKGKILGVAEQCLDYIELFDPAVYNNSTRNDTITSSSFYWADQHVGKTWWDLSKASFIDYEQGSLSYRLKNWGNLFPGSQVKIYEWVESSVPPSQYVAKGGDGIPKHGDNTAFSSIYTIDQSTGIVTQKYYFWVVDKLLVNPTLTNRTLSTTSISKYIERPRDQGISYLATLAPNSVGLFNVNDILSGTDIVLNLNLAKTRDNNLIHNEYELIQEGNPVQEIPDIVLKKLRDSLAGFDDIGSPVPDYLLSPQDQIGLSLRPRQSIFINRLQALRNYINALNSILIENPILLITTPTSLYAEEPIPENGFDAQLTSQTEFSYVNTATFPDGYGILIPKDSQYNDRWTLWAFDGVAKEFKLAKIQSYKTTLFWTPVDWYSSSYNLGTKLDYIVDTYGNIQSLNINVGNFIKVLDNGNGQWLIYEVMSDGTLALMAAQNGTLQLNQSIYNVDLGTGFDASVYDLNDFDPQIGKEFVNIFNSVYQEILIKDLALQFNKLFFDMVNYVFSEQKSPDWIFKTSFIDVYHNIRNLEKIPTYIQDNQTFYRDYINEVKPYRTKIKDYIPVYNGNDSMTGNWSDFDLPGAYDASTGVYRSLDVDSSSDLEIMQTIPPYDSWYNNYTYKIADYIIENEGSGYTVVPDIKIIGGGGSGATANCTINPATGKITSVSVLTPGQGYTSTPQIVINGTGSGASVYPVLKNEYYTPNESLSYNTIRNINTTLTFDRINYQSANTVVWTNPTIGQTFNRTVITSGVGSGNIWISSGNIYLYNNSAFILNDNYTITSVAQQTLFDYTKFVKLESSNVLLKAVDRISAYYNPEINMPGANPKELMAGVDYPGIVVGSPEFTACSFAITSNIISFNYTGLTINSGNTQQVDFQKLGFDIDQTIRVQALVPFDFMNNGYFKIINVSHDYMTLTGDPIQTTYNLTISENITANVGDVITQSNTIANAYVLANVVNSRVIPIIYTNPEFSIDLNEILINGVPTSALAQQVTTGGNVNTTISYLELDTTVLDSNIYSKYDDTSLGTRPEDINIVGGTYVDVYSSHAPEELIPGRMFDALEIRVFSNTVGNTATYGFRIFEPMSANVQYFRISDNATTTLASNVNISDSIIYLTDSSVLPDANPTQNIPGVVFVNGEKIHYYQKYDATDISSAYTWTANTTFLTGSLISVDGNTYLVKGNVYANSNSYISTSNIQQVYANTITQLLRGVDGTGAANVHSIGSLVSDSSLQQAIPGNELTSKIYTGNATVTANVTWHLTLSSNVTANVGDYITQFVGNTGNARVLGSVVSANVIAVDIIDGNLKLASNLGTRVNIANTTSYTTTTANVISIKPLGSVFANGNVVLSNTTVFNSNLWVPLGTGVGLEGSTTVAATFIKLEESYIP